MADSCSNALKGHSLAASRAYTIAAALFKKLGTPAARLCIGQNSDKSGAHCEDHVLMPAENGSSAAQAAGGVL